MAAVKFLFVRLLAVRLFLWTTGLCVSAIPLIVAVQTVPGGWDGVFSLASYVSKEAEVLYIGIALGAIIIAEMAEFLASLVIRGQRGAALMPVLILGISIVLVVFCAIYYGRIITLRDAGAAAQPGVIITVVKITLGFAALGLLSKIVIWSRDRKESEHLGQGESA